MKAFAESHSIFSRLPVRFCVVGRNKGHFTFLAIDTQPDCIDTAPLPGAGQSAWWKYKTIYLPADERIGQWSDAARIAVAGRFFTQQSFN
jgi:hypothetical protein